MPCKILKGYYEWTIIYDVCMYVVGWEQAFHCISPISHKNNNSSNDMALHVTNSACKDKQHHLAAHISGTVSGPLVLTLWSLENSARRASSKTFPHVYKFTHHPPNKPLLQVLTEALPTGSSRGFPLAATILPLQQQCWVTPLSRLAKIPSLAKIPP